MYSVTAKAPLLTCQCSYVDDVSSMPAFLSNVQDPTAPRMAGIRPAPIDRSASATSGSSHPSGVPVPRTTVSIASASAFPPLPPDFCSP